MTESRRYMTLLGDDGLPVVLLSHVLSEDGTWVEYYDWRQGRWAVTNHLWDLVTGREPGAVTVKDEDVEYLQAQLDQRRGRDAQPKS